MKKEVIWQDDIDNFIKENENDTFLSLLKMAKKCKELEKQNEELIKIAVHYIKCVLNNTHGDMKYIDMFEKIIGKPIEEILKEYE